MKKSLILLIGSVLVQPLSTWGQDVSYSTSLGLESKYVFRGELLGKETFMGDFEVAVDNLTLGIWTAQPTTDEVDWDSEINFYGGYAFELSDAVEMEIGATYYFFPTAKSDSTFETYIGASFASPIDPSVRVYYDFDLKTWTFEGSIAHSWAIAERTSFVLGVDGGIISPRRGNNTWHLGGSADIVYAFSDRASGYVGIRASGLHRGRDHFWAGAGVAVGF